MLVAIDIFDYKTELARFLHCDWKIPLQIKVYINTIEFPGGIVKY